MPMCEAPDICKAENREFRPAQLPKYLILDAPPTLQRGVKRLGWSVISLSRSSPGRSCLGVETLFSRGRC